MKYGAISAGSKEAVDTAKQIFKNGGNAFDAGVAAVFTSMTSEFALTGAGGGGILMGMDSQSKPYIYDFFVDCPIIKNKKTDFKKISVDFGNTMQNFHIGMGSTAIPGNIAGLIDIHKKKGELSLKEVLEPAIDIANNGVILSKYQAYINKLIEPILTYTDEGKKLFLKKNTFLKENDTFKNPNFASFLSIIAQEGKSFFYNGEGAQVISDFYKSYGYINRENLSAYKTITRKPISTNIGEYTIFTNPAPSYGGTLMVFLLNLLKQSNKLDSNIIDFIKAMQVTSIARSAICTNPKNEMEIEQLLDSKIFNKYLSLFNDNNFLGNTSNLSGFGSTTHISIIDKKYNVFSMTTTNGEGCGYFIPEFGIMMNNMLGEQDLNPYGFHNWETKRRLPTMICPTIVLKNNKPEFILGSGGSNRIRSAITQVLLNLIIKKMPLDEAIKSSRIHLEGNNLYTEPEIDIPHNKFLDHIKITNFESKSLFFGGVNCVTPNQAIGDQRRGGIGEVF